MSKLSSEVQCTKCQGFGHMLFNCTFKPLIIQEHEDISEKENYCVQVYEPNFENLSDLDEEDVQEEGHNTISSHKSENEINKEYNNFALVVKEEVLGNFLVEFPEEVNMVLEESHNFIPLKLPDSPPTMLDI